jgi:hypothetical protein
MNAMPPYPPFSRGRVRKKSSFFKGGQRGIKKDDVVL